MFPDPSTEAEPLFGSMVIIGIVKGAFSGSVSLLRTLLVIEFGVVAVLDASV